MTFFSFFMFVMMVIMGGIAVDLMANEMERVKRQNALDGAVLAAANLSQSITPEDAFKSYMEASGYSGEYANLVIEDGVGERFVSAQSTTTTVTRFMKLVGTPELPVVAGAAAEQVLQGLEISLVLDVSSSMASRGRLASLQPAAKRFVEIILAEGTDTSEIATINLVPYGGTVNVGDTMFDIMNGRRLTDLAAAPESYKEDRYEEMYDYNLIDAQFHAGLIAAGIATEEELEDLHEALDDGEEIPDQDLYTEIVVAFDNYLEAGDRRSCINMDPSDLSDGALPSATNYDQVPRVGNWNLPYTNPWCPDEDSRVVYLSNNQAQLDAAIDSFTLSDGTGTQYAMKWAAAFLDPGSLDEFQQLRAAGELNSEYTDRPAPHGTNKKYIVLMTDGGVSSQFRPNDVYDTRWERSKVSSSTRYTDVSQNDARVDFSEICEKVKLEQPKTIIYTIAMDAPVAADRMEACASSPSHYYSVTGSNIEDAFEAIAHNLARDALGLTQ